MVAWSSPLAVLATSGAHRVRMLLFSCSALGHCPPGIPFGCCSPSSPLPTHLDPEQPLCPHHHLQPSLGACSAPCMAQQGEEQSGGWGGSLWAPLPCPGTSSFPRSPAQPHPTLHWLFLGVPGVQCPMYASNPGTLLVLCPPPASHPQKPPASPLSPPQCSSAQELPQKGWVWISL